MTTTMTVSDFLVFLGIMAPVIGGVISYLVWRDKKSDTINRKLIADALGECREQRDSCAEDMKDLRKEIREKDERYLERLTAAIDTIATNSGTRPAQKKSDRLTAMRRPTDHA